MSIGLSHVVYIMHLGALGFLIFFFTLVFNRYCFLFLSKTFEMRLFLEFLLLGPFVMLKGKGKTDAPMVPLHLWMLGRCRN